jgi:hypothetical protein
LIVLHSAILNKLWNIGENPKKIRDSYEVVDENGAPVNDFYHAYDELGQRLFLARYVNGTNANDSYFYRAEVLKVLRETNQV